MVQGQSLSQHQMLSVPEEVDTEHPSQGRHNLCIKCSSQGSWARRRPDTQEEAAPFLGKVAQVILYTWVYEGSFIKWLRLVGQLSTVDIEESFQRSHQVESLADISQMTCQAPFISVTAIEREHPRHCVLYFPCRYGPG